MDFRKELVKAISKSGIKEAIVKEILEIPPKREMGDYALPCFSLSKELKKAPNEIAAELAGKIQLPSSFKNSEAKGPYVNFFLDETIFAKSTIEEILKEKGNYGKEKKKGGKVSVEYCQANPMKAFHIGHVRNICM